MSPFSPMSVFQTTKNYKFSLYPFLTFFSTKVLETHLGGLNAACIRPALSQFRPSVGDEATYCPQYSLHIPSQAGSWASPASRPPWVCAFLFLVNQYQPRRGRSWQASRRCCREIPSPASSWRRCCWLAVFKMPYINLDILHFSIFRAPLWWLEMPYIDLDISHFLSTRAPCS